MQLSWTTYRNTVFNAAQRSILLRCTGLETVELRHTFAQTAMYKIAGQNYYTCSLHRTQRLDMQCIFVLRY